MALIAEPLPAGMAIATPIQADVTSYSVADDFLSDPPQEFPVMKTHVGRFFHAIFILFIGALQKDLSVIDISGKDIRRHTVTDRQ
jgi:hypothetical protein